MKESKMTGGRVAVHVPGHPAANNRGYVLRYRYNMEKYLGRLLDSSEQVHHCNGNKTDDLIENLELMLVTEHSSLHSADNGDFSKRKLDYERITELRREGLGYKKIAKILNCSPNSTKSAIRKLERGHF